MDRFTALIDEARNLDELLPLMNMLLERTDALIGLGMLNADDASRLAIPIAMLRSLLTKLPATGRGAGGRLTQDLAGRFLALEGRVKQLRNDLARAAPARGR